MRNSILRRTIMFNEVFEDAMKPDSVFWTTLSKPYYNSRIIQHVCRDARLYVECSDDNLVLEIMEREFPYQVPQQADQTVDEVRAEMELQATEYAQQLKIDLEAQVWYKFSVVQ